MSSSDLKGMLIRHERVMLKPYLDSKGKITIGVGRNLDDMGITADEAMHLLENDIARVRLEIGRSLPWFKDLDDVRQDAVIDMVFNLGLTRFMSFKALISAAQKKDWDRVASEMLNSVWASQVKGRAVELAGMMRTGTYSL